MRRLHFVFRLALTALACLGTTCAQDSGASSITGHVQLPRTATSLIARLYSPKESYAQNQQAQQNAPNEGRRVRVAYITNDGRFEFSGLHPGPYLLEIYSGERLLYQKVVSTQDPQPLEIAVNTPAANAPPVAPNNTAVSKSKDTPADLTSNPTSGVFLLDTAGGVSKLVSDERGPRADLVFRIKSNSRVTSLTATADAIFGVSTANNNCTIYRYPFSGKKLAQRLVLGQQCFGLASDGTAIYFTNPSTNEIWYLDNWTSSQSHRWGLQGVDKPTTVVFDRIGRRLIVADGAGNAFAVSLPSGKCEQLASNLGVVTSLATSKSHILAASGKKVLFLARADNHGENPPATVGPLSGGDIVGVTVDGNDAMWFADFNNKLVKGPIPID